MQTTWSEFLPLIALVSSLPASSIAIPAAPPLIVCPSEVVAECTGGLTPVTYSATATDFAGNPLPVICTPPSGSGFRLGTSNVTCTATDSLGSSSSCNFIVTVQDTTPPTAHCPTDINQETGDAAGALVIYSASATDSCGLATFECTPSSGSVFPVGTTAVICAVTDSAGNSNFCTFNVTITLRAPPTIVCPSGVLVECTGGLTPATYNVTATDFAGNPLPVTCTPPSGSGFRLGTSNVTCTATDNLGSSSSCSFIVTIQDTTPPRVTCPGPITLQATSPGGQLVTYIASASDPCGLSSFNCSPPSGTIFPIGMTTVTCEATDSVGLANSCNFVVTIIAPNQCPTAVAKASPNAQLFPGQVDTIVIAVDNTNGCVVLDGTMSSDPDGDPLTYSWLTDLDGDGTKELIATGAVATNCLPVGTHDICLVVNDGQCSATNLITVDVLTPCQAEGFLILLVQNSTLTRQAQRPLISSLKAACASFEGGGLTSGVGQLGAVQNKVRAQLSATDPTLAQELIDGTQAIIDAVTAP